MAEVVGVVVGVVSLGVQLAESLQKVKRFYNTVRDAPERLADIIDEIGSLSDILTELEDDSTSSGANNPPNMQRCVAACRKAVDRFSTFAKFAGESHEAMQRAWQCQIRHEERKHRKRHCQLGELEVKPDIGVHAVSRGYSRQTCEARAGADEPLRQWPSSATAAT
jgi:hypothetical protein